MPEPTDDLDLPTRPCRFAASRHARSVLASLALISMTTGCAKMPGMDLLKGFTTKRTPTAEQSKPAVYGSRTALSDPKETVNSKTPMSASNAPKRVATAGDVAGTVIAGPDDTLLGIAERHGVAVSALMAANGLQSLTITPGQRLVIPRR